MVLYGSLMISADKTVKILVSSMTVLAVIDYPPVLSVVYKYSLKQ